VSGSDTILIGNRQISKRTLVIIAAIFAILGAYLVFRSFAATALYVAPGGAGTACTQAAPCGSIQTAWSAAAAGDIIYMKAGTYGDQTITGNKASETKVIAEAGTTIGNLTTNGSFFTLENVYASSWSSSTAGVRDVTLRSVNISGNGGVYLAGEGYSNFKWEGGSLRNFSCSNCPAAMAIYAGNTVGGSATVSNFVIDGVTFDNIKNTGGTANHFEVIRIDGNVNGYTLKNSTFTNTDASSSTLFFTTFRGNKPQNITLENNFFSAPGAAFFVINENFQGSTCSDWSVRYNTFKSPAAAGGNCNYTNIVWTGNLGPTGNCQGSSFVNNVWYGNGSTCGTSDKVIGSGEVLFDTDGFHLKTGSKAIDAAGAGANCISSDHDGGARPFDGDANGTAICDAGAHEYGSTGGTAPPPPPPPTTPTATISANPSSVTSGGSSTISWSSTNATACTASGAWSGTKATSGSQSTGALTTNSTYNLTCSGSTPASTTVTVTAPPTPTSQTPVASYAFEEGSGTTAVDASGNNNSLTLPSAAWTTSGKNGKAASFNGTVTSFGQKADNNTLDLAGTGTAEAWFKPNSVGQWHSLIAKGSANDNNTHNYALEVDNNNHAICIIGNGASSIYLSGMTTLAAGTFYHLACSWDGTSLKLYVNGVQDGSVGQSITPAGNSSSLLIGLFGGNVDPANGVVDDVRIYNKALGAAEISGDMNTPVASDPADTTPPVLPVTKTIVTSNITSNSVTLSWNAAADPSNPVRYSVYRNGAVIKDGLTSTSYTDNSANSAPNPGPSPTTTYIYTIRAVDSAGNTNTEVSNYENKQATTPAAPDTTPPNPPAGLTATAVSAAQINLSWIVSTDVGGSGIAGYNVYRGTSSEAINTKVNTSLVTGTSLGDNIGLKPGTTYYYQIEAVDGAGNVGPRTSFATATTSAGPTTLAPILPSADAWVNKKSPKRNYGNVSELKADSSPDQDTILRFDVSGIGTKRVISAKLRLYVTNSSSQGGTIHRLLNNTWSETNVSWNTAPAADTTTLVDLGRVYSGSYREIDLSSLVTTDGAYGIKITSTSSDTAVYSSKEATNKPQLILVVE